MSYITDMMLLWLVPSFLLHCVRSMNVLYLCCQKWLDSPSCSHHFLIRHTHSCYAFPWLFCFLFSLELDSSFFESGPILSISCRTFDIEGTFDFLRIFLPEYLRLWATVSLSFAFSPSIWEWRLSSKSLEKNWLFLLLLPLLPSLPLLSLSCLPSVVLFLRRFFLFLSTLLSWLLQPLILIIWCLLIFLQSFEQTEFNYRSKSQSKTKKEVNEKRDERLLNANECRVDEEIADQEEMLTPRTRWERFLLAFLQIFLYKNEFSSVVKAC